MQLNIVIVVAGLLAAAAGTFSYLRILIREESDPHWVSWLVWTLIGAIGAWATYAGGAGAIGVIVPGCFVLVTFTIFALSFSRSHALVTLWDIALGMISLATLVAWRSWGFSPGYAALAAVAADSCALYPTIRNARRAPESEPLHPWLWSSLASACGLVVLDRHTFASVAYITYLLIADAAIATVIVLARTRAAREPWPGEAS